MSDIQLPPQEPVLTYKPNHSFMRIGKPNEPHLPENTSIADLPVNERNKWLDPHQDATHPYMTQTDYSCKCAEKAKAKEEEAKAKDKKISDHESTIQQQGDTIASMAQHITTLTDTLNALLAKYPI
jgi:hypothetical protein